MAMKATISETNTGMELRPWARAVDIEEDGGFGNAPGSPLLVETGVELVVVAPDAGCIVAPEVNVELGPEEAVGIGPELPVELKPATLPDEALKFKMRI